MVTLHGFLYAGCYAEPSRRRGRCEHDAAGLLFWEERGQQIAVSGLLPVRILPNTQINTVSSVVSCFHAAWGTPPHFTVQNLQIPILQCKTLFWKPQALGLREWAWVNVDAPFILCMLKYCLNMLDKANETTESLKGLFSNNKLQGSPCGTVFKEHILSLYLCFLFSHHWQFHQTLISVLNNIQFKVFRLWMRFIRSGYNCLYVSWVNWIFRLYLKKMTNVWKAEATAEEL